MPYPMHIYIFLILFPKTTCPLGYSDLSPAQRHARIAALCHPPINLPLYRLITNRITDTVKVAQDDL